MSTEPSLPDQPGGDGASRLCLPQIVIADEDRSVCADLRKFFEKRGFRVLAANSHVEAAFILTHDRVAIAVIDARILGIDPAERLRRLSRNGSVPMIVLDDVNDMVDRIVALEAGADDWLAKPCNPQELLSRVRAVLRRAAHEPALPA